MWMICKILFVHSKCSSIYYMLQAIKYGRLMKNMHEKIDLEHERKSLNSQIQAMMKEKVTTLCIVDKDVRFYRFIGIS